MTGGDQQESLWAGSLPHEPQRQDDVLRRGPDETTAPAPRSNAQQESLWASSGAHQPERLDDVVVRWELDEQEASARPANARQWVRWRAVPLGVLAVIVVVALATALPGGGLPAVEDVPSYWADVPMTCRTVRFEQGERALELFRCHAVRGGTLPAGVYRSPGAQWTSDITRREARANEIEISAEGELTGWAAY